jgi:hypothetical protein
VNVRRLLEHDRTLVTESEWSGVVADVARLAGFELRYHTFRSKRSAHGFPDWVLVSTRQQRVVFAELKSETGRVSHEQERWITALKLCGVEAYVWRPGDFDQVAEILTGRKAA